MRDTRWEVLTLRAEKGRSYAPSRHGRKFPGLIQPQRWSSGVIDFCTGSANLTHWVGQSIGSGKCVNSTLWVGVGGNYLLILALLVWKSSHAVNDCLTHEFHTVLYTIKDDIFRLVWHKQQTVTSARSRDNWHTQCAKG